MQAAFKDIVDSDEVSVRTQIEKDPSLVNAVATGAPKKYAGQSSVQVTIRTGQFQVAKLLLKNGSDPNFADVKSPSGWVQSVLHDAAVAAVMRSRWSRRAFNADLEHVWLIAETARSDEAFEMLDGLIDAGADVTAEESKGATPPITDALRPEARTVPGARVNA